MTDPQTIVLSSIAAVAVAGCGLSTLLVFARSRAKSIVTRGACLAAVVVIVAATPWFTDFLLLRLNTTSGISQVFIDLGAPGLLVPSVLVILSSLAVGWLSRARHA